MNDRRWAKRDSGGIENIQDGWSSGQMKLQKDEEQRIKRIRPSKHNPPTSTKPISKVGGRRGGILPILSFPAI